MLQPSEPTTIVVTGRGLEPDEISRRLGHSRSAGHRAIGVGTNGRCAARRRRARQLSPLGFALGPSHQPGADAARARRQCREPGHAEPRRSAAGRPFRRLDRLHRARPARDRSHPRDARGERDRSGCAGRIDRYRQPRRRSRPSRRRLAVAGLPPVARWTRLGRDALVRRVRHPVRQLFAWRWIRAGGRRGSRPCRSARALSPGVGPRPAGPVDWRDRPRRRSIVAAYGDRRDRGFFGSDNRQRGTDASLRLVGTGHTSLVGARLLAGPDASTAGSRRSTTIAHWRASCSTSMSRRTAGVPGSRQLQGLAAIDWRAGAELRRVSGTTFEDFRFIGGAPTRQREAGGESSTVGLFGGATVDSWRMDLRRQRTRGPLGNGRGTAFRNRFVGRNPDRRAFREP